MASRRKTAAAVAPASDDMTIEYRDPRELVPYGRNSRTHSPAQIEQIRRSIREFGFRNPILLRDDGKTIGAGHGRREGAILEELPRVPTIILRGLSEAQWRAYVIADNKIAEGAGWDLDMLKAELGDLSSLGFDLTMTGFDSVELSNLMAPPKPKRDANAIPAASAVPVSRLGDVWQLGAHRVMCGDSTSAADVALLADGHGDAPLLHADPPYGMGKQADGVLNDNLYAAKLDAFQMDWWRAWRPFLAVNASAYIWGNAEDLWRFWHGTLAGSERMTFRNEVVWNKECGMGMNSEHHRQFATATERALFFMLGEQGFGNVNKDDYFEGFEPIRSYLEAQAKAADIGAREVKEICGVNMFGHWFSKSQWTMIPEKHYVALQAAAGGKAFGMPYAELRRLYDDPTASGAHASARRAFFEKRSYFDNVHDNMNDVWNFPRVLGEDRHGHATPKPVEMVARAIKSSAPAGALVLEPFCGSGSTLIAAETCGRACLTMELNPAYVDVTVRRWQAFTGETAVLLEDGRTFAEVEAERSGDEPI